MSQRGDTQDLRPAYVQRSALTSVGIVQPEELPSLARASLPDAGEIVEETLVDTEIVGSGDDAASVDQAQIVRSEVETLPREPVAHIARNVAEDTRLANGLKVSKRLIVNGQTVGTAQLAIDSRSRLHILSADLGYFLPGELSAFVQEGESYVGFHELRARGLDVHYDPVTDAVQIVS